MNEITWQAGEALGLATNWKLSCLLKAYKMASNCSSCCSSIEGNGKM